MYTNKINSVYIYNLYLYNINYIYNINNKLYIMRTAVRVCVKE